MSARKASDRRFSTEELRPLQPWAEAFADMPEDQIRLIGRLFASIWPLIETAEDERRSGVDELDGFDDVIASGPLERLIPSEFLWLKALPIEFVRRIAEREALRRRPVYQDPADDRAVILLLDAGPAMLGRRRLAALGALFALGVATRRRGARLLWTSTGFRREPFWLDGLDRRGLARFVSQTSSRYLSPAFCAERLNDLEERREDDAFWLVGAAGAIPPEPRPDFRIEIDEAWPELDTAPETEPERLSPSSLDIRLIAADVVRREARISLPDEQHCAETLRAPFQNRPAAPREAPTSWAPRHVFQEGDGGAIVFRMGDELIVRGPGARRLRVVLPTDATLVGIRAAAQTNCAVVWLTGSTLHRALIAHPQSAPEVLSADLPAEHPLIAQSHPANSLPPAFRFGGGQGLCVAAPSGEIFDLARVDSWSSGTLAVAPLANASGLRVLGWAQRALLCINNTHATPRPFLRMLRNGAHQAIAFDRARPVEGPVRGCLTRKEIGALISDSQGVLWAPPTGLGAEPAPQPDVPTGAILLEVSSPWSGSAQSGLPSGWGFVAHVPDEGFVQFWSHDGLWRTNSLPTPDLPGEVLGAAQVGKRRYALCETDAFAASSDGSTLTLLDIRNREVVARSGHDSGWLRDAPCVEL